MSLGDALFIAGFAFTVIGFVALVAASLLSRSQRYEHVRRDFGGVVLIGPFPIIFGSSRRMARLMILVAMIFIGLIFVFSVLPLVTGG